MGVNHCLLDREAKMAKLFPRLTTLLAFFMKHEVFSMKIPYDVFRILVKQAMHAPSAPASSYGPSRPNAEREWALKAVTPFFIHSTDILLTAVHLSLRTFYPPGTYGPTALDGGFYRGCHIWGPSLRDWADWCSDFRISLLDPIGLIPIKVVGWEANIIEGREELLSFHPKQTKTRSGNMLLPLPLGVDWEDEEAVKVERERRNKGYGYH